MNIRTKLKNKIHKPGHLKHLSKHPALSLNASILLLQWDAENEVHIHDSAVLTNSFTYLTASTEFICKQMVFTDGVCFGKSRFDIDVNNNTNMEYLFSMY